MTPGRTPEELDTLLEDALLLQDDHAVTALFEESGVVICWPRDAVGPAQAAALLSQRDYVASTGTATVVRDVAVTVGDHTVNLSRRGRDGSWRLLATIVFPCPDGWGSDEPAVPA